MTRPILWLVAVLAVLQFSPGLGKSIQVPDDDQQSKGYNETGISGNPMRFEPDFWTWNPFGITDSETDFVVKPNVRNFDDITVDFEAGRSRDNATGAAIGITIGSLCLGLLLLIACVKLCCKRRTTSRGFILGRNEWRASEVQPTQPVLQHLPPPPSYEHAGQYLPTPYPVGTQYSPPMQFPHEQVSTSPYGAPPVFKY